MKAVNLLPPKTGRAAGLRAGGGDRKTTLIALGAVAAVAALGWVGWTSHQQASDLAGRISSAQADKMQLETQLQTMVSADKQAAQQAVRRGAVVTLTSGRINWERLVRDTVTVVPKGVWLNQISGTSPAPSTGASAAASAATPQANTSAPEGLHIEGFAMTQPQVAEFMARLNAVPGLGEGRLASSDRLLRGSTPVIQFILDIPIDQRAQDRPTLDVSSSSASTTATSGTAAGGFVP